MAVISVLGGGGFIGSNLTKKLVAQGHRVRVVDIHFPPFRKSAWDGADCWTLDLTNRDHARNAIDGADWVFHLAADMGGVGYFHSDADRNASMTNGRITLNVLEHADLCGQIFYAASACAYPIEKMGVPLTEDLLGHGTPDALYGAEKLHGIRLCSKTGNARVGIFDTIYGPLQEHEGRRMKFPAAVSMKALHAVETGMLELWGDGTQERCYLYIDDALDRILQVMTMPYRGPVNIGARGTVTCHEIARLCLKHVGAESAVIMLNPNEPSGVPTRELDPTKFNDTYGEPGQTSHEDGFGQMLESFKTATRTPRKAVREPQVR